MGDGADMLIDSFFDDDEWGFYADHRAEKRVVCKYCGEDDLHWETTGNGWRLFNEDDEMHSCKVKEPPRKGKPTL